MPAHRLDMRLIKEVLRLKFTAGLSHRQIAVALRIGIGTVSNYLAAFERAALAYPLPAELDETELARLLFPPAASFEPPKFVLPDFTDVHEQLRRKGVTRQLLWEEYCQQHGSNAYCYTQFCVLYTRWQKGLRLSMRQTHRAGEKLFVDYCGQTVSVINAATGEVSEAQVFVAVLGASNYTFAEATASQKLEDWIGSHARAFAFFGDAPQLVVPDNLKSGVTRACRYEPLLNQTYAEMLRHYNIVALPARPLQAKRQSQSRSRRAGGDALSSLPDCANTSSFRSFELNLAIRRLLDDLNNRVFKRLPGSRRSRFDELEKAALQPLPAEPYEYAEWRRARVGIDYHVEVDRHYYSVPAILARRSVEVRLTATSLECFASGKRVAVHARSRLQGSHSTVPEHMPKAHRAHLEWTPGRFLNWANEIGESTREVVKHLLWTRPHPEMGYRSCLRLLSLEKRYGRDRLDDACRRALTIGSPHRRSIVSILEQGLDRLPLVEEVTAAPPVVHENIRGSSYYQ